MPGAQGVGVDISAEALTVAAHNAQWLNILPSHVLWCCGDGLGPVTATTFNIIISNPPYIPTPAIAGLDSDVRHFDPHIALDGGADGLIFYRDFARQFSQYFSNGWIVLEVGNGQAPQVADLLRVAYANTRLDIRIYDDLAGVQRCVAASPLNIA